MVSNARELFPEPLLPETTMSLSLGKLKVDIFEVVFAGAFNDDLVHHSLQVKELSICLISKLTGLKTNDNY
jgi:hypothetical protein